MDQFINPSLHARPFICGLNQKCYELKKMEIGHTTTEWFEDAKQCDKTEWLNVNRPVQKQALTLSSTVVLAPNLCCILPVFEGWVCVPDTVKRV